MAKYTLKPPRTLEAFTVKSMTDMSAKLSELTSSHAPIAIAFVLRDIESARLHDPEQVALVGVDHQAAPEVSR
jgi:hypothetical protein